MEMEVVVPAAAAEFNFDSNCSSPYITAPSSPQRLAGNFFYSAPASPTRISSFLDHHSSASSSSVPFHWEQQPGLPKSNNHDEQQQQDFEFNFNFSAHPDRPSLSADELFDGGKIRPLKPPPRLQSGDGATSPGSSSRSKLRVFSPRHRQKRDNLDPFAAAIEETRRRGEEEEEEEGPGQQEKRGRERASFAGRKGSRSLSPLRVSDVMVCEDPTEENGGGGVPSPARKSSSYASFLSSIPFTRGYRKWRLRDFLLFRSASEGRATDKDPLRRKYEVLSRKAAGEEDVRNCSFRSTESSGSVSKRRGPVSAHELHYTLNRAASEELKRRTFLPYRRGLLGCLGFNPGAGAAAATTVHDISRGIASFSRS